MRSPRQPRPRFTFANVCALLALFVALGGTSVAAPVGHAARSVIRDVARALHQSKNATAESRKAVRIARASAAMSKRALDRTLSPGPAGPAGPAGPGGTAGTPGVPGRPGANGSAIGYATVEYCPGNCPDQPLAGWFTPDEEAVGVDNQANFNHPAAGVFCFQQLPFHAHTVVANLGPSTDTVPHNNYTVQTAVGTTEDPIPGPCQAAGAADQNAVVYIRDSNGAEVDPDQSAKLLLLFN